MLLIIFISNFLTSSLVSFLKTTNNFAEVQYLAYMAEENTALNLFVKTKIGRIGNSLKIPGDTSSGPHALSDYMSLTSRSASNGTVGSLSTNTHSLDLKLFPNIANRPNGFKLFSENSLKSLNGGDSVSSAVLFSPLQSIVLHNLKPSFFFFF